MNDAAAMQKRKRQRAHPGIAADARARREIRALLGEASLQRPLLIEYLHRLQDRFGHLRIAHLRALAAEMNLPQSEVYETASFYHNFDIAADGTEKPAPTVHVCDGLSCTLAGTETLIGELTRLAAENGDRGFRIKRSSCLGRCDGAPAVRIGEHCLEKAQSGDIAAALQRPAPPALPEVPLMAQTAVFAVYRRIRDNETTVDEVLQRIEAADLRGLGGAGFPTARKWRLFLQQPRPRLMVVNADESEPGAFKDRFFLLERRADFLEGMLIAAACANVAEIYIYLRDEYADIRAILQQEIAALAARFPELPPIRLRRGAGAYICGEESAMLESIEGKRPYPRHKPPFPVESGLFGRPTLINNVETLSWLPPILGDAPPKVPMRAYSVSGRVRIPGVKIAPRGITMQRLIDDYCGGMAEGHRLYAFLPGGASGGILPAAKADLPLEFGALEKEGAFIGSASVIVLSDRDDVISAARNLMRFFADESCGQCTPCRIGCARSVEMMSASAWDTSLLEELSRCMADASICGLGQAAPNGLLSLLRHFSDLVPGRQKGEQPS